MGVDFYELSLAETQEMHPLVNLDGVRCVMFEPDGGNVDPSGVTHAYATGARQRGAEIHRFTPVTATTQRPDGTWDVETPNGNIHAEWVINAAGLWAREVAALAGVELPLQPTEHQYFVTETIPEIEQLGRRLPSVADRDGEYYMRQEGNGLLIGAYEKHPQLWAEDRTPADFGHELFADDLERIEDNMLRALDRVPAAATAGIKRVINGPMIWSPDAAALYGPVPELQNYFCCCGIIPGFSQSGGLGLMSAQWIVEGEPELDMFPWDVARFGKWATRQFVQERVVDQYSKRFAIHFPYEERTAGRPVRTRPIHSTQQSMGCVFGLSYGWEHPQWFAGEGGDASETYGFTRQAWFDAVGRECRALRRSVGIVDVSNFGKYVVRGEGAAEWLDRIIANHVPKEDGRSCLTPLLGERGGIAGDFTVTRIEREHFVIIGSGIAERYHQRYFAKVPKPQSVHFESVSDAWCGFNVAGPRSRELLRRLTQEDLSNEAWRFMRSRRFTVAGIDAVGLRVSFTGDLGWEIYVPSEFQVKLHDALFEAGRDLDVCPVGSRSLLCLRVEKGYGSWSREYSPEYWPHEVGLDRLIKLEKQEFLGRDAYVEISKRPPRELLVNLAVDVENADASGGEPVFLPDGTPVGRVSSGAYGFSVDRSLALSFISLEHAVVGTEFDVAILGRPHRAVMLDKPAFDPEGKRLRA